MSPLILAGICVALVLLQRDVGQTLLILMVVFAVILYAGVGIEKILKYGFIILFGIILVGGLFLLLGAFPD
ncbi:FtsW/RodA/SpoVE family cell cycle protein, partial [Staphylococcus epidermidis]